MGHDHEMNFMVSEIQLHSRQSENYTGIKEISNKVIEAIRKVPREEFLPGHMRDMAYQDNALAIGHGQTISQPFIVALMAEVLQLNGEMTLLEIGTGCGYHAAVLSRLCKKVYSIDIIPDLVEMAQNNLENYSNVEVFCRNGRNGLKEFAPFDAISIAAATEEIPPVLLSQLAPGGRMVLPIGERYSQLLVLVEKDKNGNISQKDILPVAFVPFVKD